MATIVEAFKIEFPHWYDERAETEARDKGYLSGVQVMSADGAVFTLTFYDPVRLSQTQHEDMEARRYFMEPGLVVVPEVTAANVRAAINGLWHEGCFRLGGAKNGD
jgi:hypothetical protein